MEDNFTDVFTSRLDFNNSLQHLDNLSARISAPRKAKPCICCFKKLKGKNEVLISVRTENEF